MQTYLDCYPCVLRQALEAARMAGASDAQQRTVVKETLTTLQSLPEGTTPPELGSEIHRMVRELTGHDDPYREAKDTATRKALALLPKLRALVRDAADPIETAIRISIAGNIIDLGPNPDYDLWETVERVLRQPFAIDHLSTLRQRLTQASSVLYLGDNTGETVFDRVLIETLDKPVTYVVRGGPVLNDATRPDAQAAGLDSVAEIIDNGARITGTVLSDCSKSFRERFESAQLILAKGMGNYETLSTVQAPIFFLLQVKCSIIGVDIGAPQGAIVIKAGPGIEQGNCEKPSNL
ncbi:DUF89 family protein [bacterium]|nr:DUF89 family protein [bacterium]